MKNERPRCGAEHFVERRRTEVIWRALGRQYLWRPRARHRSVFAVRSNYGANNTSSVRKSVLNGQTIKMEQFKGTPREYAAHLRGMNSSFLMFMFDECYWQKTPKMILAVDLQYQQFRQNGIDSGLDLIGQLEGRSPAYNCGSVRAFLAIPQK